jgi:hypothetical protein
MTSIALQSNATSAQYTTPEALGLAAPSFYLVQDRQWHTSLVYKDTCLKEIRLCIQILITTLHSIVDIIGRTYVFSLATNKRALFSNHNHN